LTELENILSNQKALDKKMSKVSINEKDKTLFTENKMPKEVNIVTKFNNKRESSGCREGWQRGQHCQ